ncbi:MAG: DUF1573 domain-containing protein [Verrucomicrobiaceae bacterium]|nr:MAG: DUF1573 domain-containing protein [Verrucomicrobiaceae bacterium]
MRHYCILISLLFCMPIMAFAELEFGHQEIEIKAKPSDEVVSFVFPFKNVGNGPVSIIDVNLTCSCLSAKTDKGSYGPGEEGHLKAIFSIGSFTGIQRKSMTLISQDEGKEKVRNSLLAILTIPDVVTIEPELIKWQVGEDPVAKTFTFKVPYVDPIKITNVSCTREGFDVSVVAKKEGREYEIKIKPQKTSKPMLGMIKIETDSKLKKHSRKLAFFSIARKRR